MRRRVIIVASAELPMGVMVATGPDGVGPFDLIQAFVSSQAAFEAQLGRVEGGAEAEGAAVDQLSEGAARIKSDITRDTIWRYARTVGLDGVAMVAVDETWSAMRLKRVK